MGQMGRIVQQMLVAALLSQPGIQREQGLMIDHSSGSTGNQRMQRRWKSKKGKAAGKKRISDTERSVTCDNYLRARAQFADAGRGQVRELVGWGRSNRMEPNNSCRTDGLSLATTLAHVDGQGQLWRRGPS